MKNRGNSLSSRKGAGRRSLSILLLLGLTSVLSIFVLAPTAALADHNPHFLTSTKECSIITSGSNAGDIQCTTTLIPTTFVTTPFTIDVEGGTLVSADLDEANSTCIGFRPGEGGSATVSPDVDNRIIVNREGHPQEPRIVNCQIVIQEIITNPTGPEICQEVLDALGAHVRLCAPTPVEDTLCVPPLFAGGPVPAGYNKIVGTSGNDTLVGTAGPDVIFGLGGNDSISGLGGDDIIFGGPGDDSISAGSGNDRVTGGAGNDSITGGSGDDCLSGSLGNDSITGGAGNDALHGGAGNDSISGGDGNDFIDGGEHTDACTGGSGTDHGIGCETKTSLESGD